MSPKYENSSPSMPLGPVGYTPKGSSHWTVLKSGLIFQSPKQRHAASLVQCKCGSQKLIINQRLKSGRTLQCKECVTALANKARADIYSKKDFQLVTFNWLFERYKYTANENKIAFDIDFDVFVQLIQTPCFWEIACKDGGFSKKNPYVKRNGEQLKCLNGKRSMEQLEKHSIWTVGLDKIDPAGGYTMNNVKPCCHQCNFIKSAYTISEMRAWPGLADNIKDKIDQIMKDSY